MKLKNLLKEASISEPPESVLKGALDIFRKQTNLPVASPTIVKNTPSFISYESSLGKFITGALMPLVVDEANLLIIVTPSKNSIGGYKFQFYAKIKTKDGKETGGLLLTVLYVNNKFRVM